MTNKDIYTLDYDKIWQINRFLRLNKLKTNQRKTGNKRYMEATETKRLNKIIRKIKYESEKYIGFKHNRSVGKNKEE